MVFILSNLSIQRIKEDSLSIGLVSPVSSRTQIYSSDVIFFLIISKLVLSKKKKKKKILN